jgi:uncharacterized membrane protein YczE
MFKPLRKKTILRELFQIQVGFALFGLAIGIIIRANVGTSAWVVLEVALSQWTGLTPGTISVIVGLAVVIIALTLREQVGWGTLANMLCIGPWEDLSLRLIPPVTNNLPVQIAMLMGSVILMGLASAIYIGVDAGAGPRDSLMLAVKRTSGWSLRLARGTIEVTVFALGWLLGGPAGLGTLAFALLIGPSVQWWFKLLKVEPHKSAEASAD